MDYVKRRLEQARQQVLAETIEEAMKKHKLSQGHTQVTNNKKSIFEKLRSFFNMPSILTGVAAGVAVAAIASISNLSEFDDKQTKQAIDRLNGQLETLAENIHVLETQLARMLEKVDASTQQLNLQLTANQQKISELAKADVPPNALESSVALSALEAHATAEIFTPTHAVTTNLNLRSSASLEAPLAGILSAGAKVQKIGESGDWYYVNTEEYGKGWCFARYLSVCCDKEN